ncbi:MAG: hypothetical protein JWO82_3366 [Akkermansiaceae bacterium]|nr:hypothetical protein [Akkermansiaceae bacterium]
MNTTLRGLFGKMAFLVLAGTLAFVVSSSAESLERSVLGSGGRVAQAGSVTLSYTVGEAFAGTGGSGLIAVSPGYQQPSGYDFWSQSHGLTTGPLADPDHDGLPNLLEYALGTDPLDPSSRGHVQISIGVDGKLYVTAAKNPAASGLTWGAEGSKDLVVWTSSSVNIALNSATIFTALFNGDAPAFLRLRIGLSGSS